MKKIHVYRLVFLFLCFPGTLQAIASNLPGAGDKLFIHLDKNLYCAGERLQYRIFATGLPAEQTDLPGTILYFALTDCHARTILEWRTGTGYAKWLGAFDLPADLKPGVYSLYVYTNSSRRDPAGFQNLLIISLSTPLSDTILLPVNEKVFSQSIASDGISVTMKDTVVATGDTVTAIVNLKSGTRADISASASLQVPILDIQMPGKNIPPQENTGTELSFSPEYRYFELSGILKNNTTNALIRGGHVLLAVIDSAFPHIRYARVDSAGHFAFYLNRWFDNRDLILQYGGNAIEGGIRWDIDNKQPVLSSHGCKPYVLTKNDQEAILSVNEIRLVESVYNEQGPLIETEPVSPGTNYFHPVDLVIKPADFTDMVNFRELTGNILPAVHFINRNDNFLIQVYNPKTGLWPESQMVLLNGVPFFDMRYVATLGTKDISRIEIITGNYLLGDLTLGGLISIYTNDHKMPASYIKNRTYVYENKVIPGGAAKVNKAGSDQPGHYPDLRMNLLWEPEKIINSDSRLVLRFPASSLTGKYEVVINGITADGKIISGTAYFEVK